MKKIVLSFAVLIALSNTSFAAKKPKPIDPEDVLVRKEFVLKEPYSDGFVIVNGEAVDEENLYAIMRDSMAKMENISTEYVQELYDQALTEFFSHASLEVMRFDFFKDVMTMTWDSCVEKYSDEMQQAEEICSELEKSGLLGNFSPEELKQFEKSGNEQSFFRMVYEKIGVKTLQINYRHEFHGTLKKWDFDFQVLDGIDGELLYHAHVKTSKSYVNGVLPILQDFGYWIAGKSTPDN